MYMYYVILHDKTNHIALDIYLRYRPKQLPNVIMIIFHFFAWIDREIIPLHKNLLRTCSFKNAILTELWLKQVSCVANIDRP